MCISVLFSDFGRFCSTALMISWGNLQQKVRKSDSDGEQTAECFPLLTGWPDTMEDRMLVPLTIV